MILSVFGAIEFIISGANKENKLKEELIREGKEVDIMDLCLTSIKQHFQKKEDIIKLRNKILDRIKKFKDDLLMFTLYRYLLKQSSNEEYIFSLLPDISKECFEFISEGYLEETHCHKLEFLNLLTLTKRFKDSLSYAQLTLKCLNRELILFDQIPPQEV